MPGSAHASALSRSTSRFDYGFAAQFHHGLAAEEFQQDRDALSARHDLGDNRTEAVKKFADDLDLIAGLDFLRDNVEFVSTESFGEFLDHVVGDGRPAVAEMDHVLHARGIANARERFVPVEPRKKVTGKEGFSDPDFAPAPGPGEMDAGKKDLDLLHQAQAAGGKVLVLLLRAQAKPGAAGRHV